MEGETPITRNEELELHNMQCLASRNKTVIPRKVVVEECLEVFSTCGIDYGVCWKPV